MSGRGQQVPKVLCEYSSNAPSAENATINLTIELGTVKGSLPPADLGNRYEPVPALGYDAILVIEKGVPKGTGELPFAGSPRPPSPAPRTRRRPRSNRDLPPAQQRHRATAVTQPQPVFADGPQLSQTSRGSALHSKPAQEYHRFITGYAKSRARNGAEGR